MKNSNNKNDAEVTTKEETADKVQHEAKKETKGAGRSSRLVYNFTTIVIITYNIAAYPGYLGKDIHFKRSQKTNHGLSWN